jgi:peptide/nickel transport system substrate-binding protein
MSGMDRRRLLEAGGFAVLSGIVLSGCDLLSTNPSGKARAQGSGTGAKEAPMLTEMVERVIFPR